MKQWGQHIRRAIGLGFIWGAAWFSAGILLARVSSLEVDLPFALLFTPFGFAAGIIFSGILTFLESLLSIDRMSLSHFAGCGAVSGLLMSGIVVVASALSGETLGGEVLVWGPVLAVAITVCAAGSLAVARRAAKQELPH